MEIKRYDNKVVLVTGGTSGIGRATAVAFAREGAQVVMAARRENLGAELIDEISAQGGKAEFIKTDIRVPEEIDYLFQEIHARYGRLDVAFNNAGRATVKLPPAAKIPEEEWDDILNTNLRGTWLCMKHEISMMLRQGGGVIVNTASVLGLSVEYGYASYCASKHGIIGLTKTAALEYVHRNIRVNAVCPGPIRTEMITVHFPKYESAVIANTPMRRIGEPDEIANAVLWLCSDESSFMTGRELVVSGGQGVLS